jgi:hypothetical protein
VLASLALAGVAGATEESGSGRAGACGAMAFATLGVDSGGPEAIVVDSTTPVDVIGVDLAVPCTGPVVATFYAQVPSTTDNYSSIFLVAECVAPAVPGGCTPGTSTRSQPRGTSFGGPDYQLFQLSGLTFTNPATIVGVFPSIGRGHYAFRAQAAVQVGGQLNLRDLVLLVQTYGAPGATPAR